MSFHARPIHHTVLRGVRYDVDCWVNRGAAAQGHVVFPLLSGSSGTLLTVSGWAGANTVTFNRYA